MKLREFIKSELSGWGKYERIIFPLVILLIIAISFILNDSKIALVSAICGISYTILAGKGKISCYLFGLMGTMCYAYISWKNQLFGNLLLYLIYYFPMQILGIFKWKKHLNKNTGEIIKTKLNTKERILYFAISAIITTLFTLILYKLNDANPIIDAITTTFSITGLILTIKRTIEQWYLWAVVNTLSVIMWLEAYINGSNCFATILMWGVYTILAIYFLHNWKKEISEN
ncbi:nicotinamide mononucleotide transporter [bacterium]|nr:nicotinamide mononucleotide transporter [bacterium]